jgi:hypothetical protein
VLDGLSAGLGEVGHLRQRAAHEDEHHVGAAVRRSLSAAVGVPVATAVLASFALAGGGPTVKAVHNTSVGARIVADRRGRTL